MEPASCCRGQADYQGNIQRGEANSAISTVFHLDQGTWNLRVSTMWVWLQIKNQKHDLFPVGPADSKQSFLQRAAIWGLCRKAGEGQANPDNVTQRQPAITYDEERCIREQIRTQAEEL